MKTPDPVLRKEFSWKERAASFGYAWKGIRSFFETEHNAWIHCFLTLVAFCMSAVLNVSKTEFILLLFVITLVWTMEIINTAIEKAMDFISLEKHPQIKLVKDLAAAAVLVAAVAALLTGTLIFLPKLVQYV